MTISIRTAGRRTYFDGDTYRHRDTLRKAGAHWDVSARAWWIGDRKSAEEIVSRIAGGSSQEASAAPDARPEIIADNTRIRGMVEYKGRSYLWLAETRDGTKKLIAFQDGSKQFWATASECRITKTYHERTEGSGRYRRTFGGMTFGRLRRLREEWRSKTPEQRAEDQRARELGGRCRCDRPIDEGDGECVQCGYLICR